MRPQMFETHCDRSKETNCPRRAARFLITEEDSAGSVAAFKATLPPERHMLPPAYSHDRHEKTIYVIDGVEWRSRGF
jgi:hypothetical protein